MPSTLILLAGPPLPGRWALARALARRLNARSWFADGAPSEQLARLLDGGASVVAHGDLCQAQARAALLAVATDERLLVEWRCSRQDARREIFHRWARRAPSLVERDMDRYRSWAASVTPIDDGETEVVLRVGAGAPLSDQVLRVIAATRPRSMAVEKPSHRVNVLVVEDDLDQRELIGEVLRELGCGVELAPDAGVALALLDADPHGFDLLLSDERMPGMGGAALAAEVARLHPHVRSVLLTAHPDAEMVDRALRAHAANVLSKPLSVVDLQHVIDDL
jgi:CheY-like chemotaxis protein/predicted kinase